MPALGIAEESPQPDVGGARTCNVKPDPWVMPKKLKIETDSVNFNISLRLL